jgi:hypothetical protein
MTSVIGARLIEALLPYMTDDHADYLDVIGSMADDFESYVNQFGEEDAWGPLMDVDRCPPGGLPYLAQFLGEVLPDGIEEVMAREWIRDHAHMRRGTLESIARAAQRSMTGVRTVSIVERSGGGANPEDYLDVTTYASETPNPTAVLEDLRLVVPADLDLTYTVATSATWSGIKTTYASWTAAMAVLDSWETMLGKAPGSDVWDRPRPIP